MKHQSHSPRDRLGQAGARLLVAVLLAATTATTSNAQSITTTFAGGNQQVGAMFDLTTFGSSLFITALDINVRAWSGANLLVYTRDGGYGGKENDPAAWTLRSTSSLASVNPLGTATHVVLSPFALDANSVFGFYVTFDRPCFAGACEDRQEYSNGAGIFANADLRLDLGVGKDYPFAATFSPRTWNGTVYYELRNPSVVPEPISIILLGTGLAAVMVARRRRRGHDVA
jgi:hypothetical protein